MCCWQWEKAVNKSRLDPETGRLVCTMWVQLFFPSNIEHPSLLKEDSALFTIISLLSAIFPDLFKKRPFPVLYSLHQRLSQCYLAIFEFFIAIGAACMIHLSVLLNIFVVLLFVHCHAWDFGGLAILQGKFFLAYGCQCAIWLSPGSFPPKVTLVISASGRCSFGQGAE